MPHLHNLNNRSHAVLGGFDAGANVCMHLGVDQAKVRIVSNDWPHDLSDIPVVAEFLEKVRWQAAEGLPLLTSSDWPISALWDASMVLGFNLIGTVAKNVDAIIEAK